MSGFSSIALPGSVPTYAEGGRPVTAASLFSGETERAAYRGTFEGVGVQPKTPVKVRKVSVRIFDLSDAKQVSAYERLWGELLEKASRMEVVVDHHKDLVQRKDGTSYWMKYVEYVEFGPDDGAAGNRKEDGNGHGNG